ncbi:MAG: hypothetical protein ICV87_06025 [Gemmatimonadetes bacterium]|nr:hypothetical protein [Gemmatimonadota bacterium]
MKRIVLALACAALAACTPDATGPNSRPVAQRWGFAGGDRGSRDEFDGATMELRGSIVRVWMRSVRLEPNGSASPPISLRHEEFDCARGLRRLVLSATGRDGVLGKPVPVGTGQDVWKQGTHDPHDRTNRWGQNLVHVCRAAGVPYAAADSLPPRPAGAHLGRYTLRSVDGVELPADIRDPDVLPALVTAGHVELFPGGRFVLSRTARYAPPLNVNVHTEAGTFYLDPSKLEMVAPSGFIVIATLRGSVLSYRQGNHVYVFSK